MNRTLQLWRGVLWEARSDNPHAYCPEHRQELEIQESDMDVRPQDSPSYQRPHIQLICPEDLKGFDMGGVPFWVFRRRYIAAYKAKSLADVDIVSLDGFQVPITKARPPENDAEYWVEARINSTKQGKQLVVYAGKRGESDKTQIFLDLENDKISFDQNNIHPNDVFIRLTGEFVSGRRVQLDDRATG